MPIERERKYLVIDDGWRHLVTGERVVQGYLSLEASRCVRVRRKGSKAFVTIKGEKRGDAREEFEYEIPIEDAIEMLDHLCIRPLISKTRFGIETGGLLWQIDVFEGENEGLVLAELEAQNLEGADLPSWLGAEVTDDLRYYNSNLVKMPYSRFR